MDRPSRQAADPQPRTDRASKLHLLAILVVTIGVMIGGVLVVAFPEQAGVPRGTAVPTSSAVATPAAPDGGGG